MASRVFFSFHYQDVIDFRANVVRNHGNFKLNSDEAGYYDSSMWEKAKKESDVALKKLINNGLQYTSNTCVLIGSETYKRPWVRYELLKSLKKGNHILGIHINSVKDKNGHIKNQGLNPFEHVGIYAENSQEYHLVYKSLTNDKWHYYEEIDGTSRVSVKHALKLKEVLPLTKFFNTYNWVHNDGYNNFSKWVK